METKQKTFFLILVLNKFLEWSRTTSAVHNSTILLILMHIVGIIGLSVESLQPIFYPLVPFNLVVTCGFLLVFHLDWNWTFLGTILLISTLGFFVEVIGVNTGFPFGDYRYQGTLGLKAWSTPLVIGVNWLILVYGMGTVISPLRIPNWLKALIAAIMLTLLDYLIEPVAIKHHFWAWFYWTVPLQNYVGWFVVSFVLQLIFMYSPFIKKNAIAWNVIMIQIIFFMIMNYIEIFISK